MSSEINELAVFASVTLVGMVCAAVVDATPLRWITEKLAAIYTAAWIWFFSFACDD